MKKALMTALWAITCCLPGYGEVPRMLNYQGRIQVGTQYFDGTGQFKFALVNAAGTQTYWSNDGTSSAGSEPTAGVALPVLKGLYSVLLGDTTRQNMTALPPDAFASVEVYLRIWFNNGSGGFQRLLPDQRIAAVGYAIMASSVADGVITSQKLANASVTSEKLGPASVGTTHLNDGAVTQAKLDGSFGFWEKSGSILSHSGGVGIGTAAPRFALEVADINSTVAMISGSHPFGTFLGLQNTTAGGDAWSIGYSGRSHIQGSGNLIFNRGTGPAKMRIDPEGNLNVAGDLRAKSLTLTGNVQAKNLPFIKYLQDRNPERAGFETPKCNDFEIYQLTVDVPFSGLLDIRGHVTYTGRGPHGGAKCYVDPNEVPLPGFPTREEHMAGRIALWLELSGADGSGTLVSSAGRELEPDVYGGGNAARLDVSLILPVQPGQVKFRIMGWNTTLLGIQEKNLTAVFFPSQSE